MSKLKKEKEVAQHLIDSSEPDLDELLSEIPVRQKRRTKEQLEEYYIDADRMHECIRQYYKDGNLTNELADMILKIAVRLGYAGNFRDYSYKDSMVGDALIRMMSALTRKKFTCDSGFSPFSYFTTIAYRAFQGRIKIEKKIGNTLSEYQEEMHENWRAEGYVPTKKNTHHNDESNFRFQR